MTTASSRLVIGFACLANFYQHILTALFLTLVLVLERDWGLPYERLIALWTPGALMLGLGAPLAGWLADRWGETRVMILFFFGASAAAALCAVAETPLSLGLGLALLGLFCSINHPVGMSWAIKNAVGRGKVIGVVGICGSLGVALAAITAGALSDAVSWRAAFLVPGALSLVTGGGLIWALAARRVVDRERDLNPEPEAARSDVIRALLTLTVAMLISSVVYAAFKTALPKWLSQGLDGFSGESILGIGALITGIYLVGSLAQLVGGPLADRWSVKGVYVLGFLIKLPVLIVAGYLTGWPMVAAAVVVVFMLSVGSPAGNILIAKYSPSRHRGLAYGIRHFAGFIAAPLGVQMVARFYGWFAGFTWLFVVLGGLVLVALLAALMLPGEGDKAPRPAPSAAE